MHEGVYKEGNRHLHKSRRSAIDEPINAAPTG